MARKRAAALRISSPVYDHGPEIRRRRGEVVVLERPDPDAPDKSGRTIKRAEVAVIYHQMWAAGRLTDEEHEAADRFSIALETVAGASDAVSASGSVPAWSRHPITERMVQAAADLRAAQDLLGRKEMAFLLAVAGYNHWPGEPEPERLRSALAKLAEFWKL